MRLQGLLAVSLLLYSCITGLANAADLDADGIADAVDNCISAKNSDQTDTDKDGYGNRCDPDFNNDARIDFSDQAFLKQRMFGADQLTDLNNDGKTDFADLAIMKSMFFESPGSDNDFDGIANTNDNCPDNYNPNQEDLDKDNSGDACDQYVPIANALHPYGLVMAKHEAGVVTFNGNVVTNPTVIEGTVGRDFDIFDYDGPGIGTLRDCTPTKDCIPTRDCSADHIDCTPTRDCNVSRSHDTRNCSACLLRNPFGGCIIRGNDPTCEAAKAAQNAWYDADYARRKLDCERNKLEAKAACEVNKSAWKFDCERIKSSEKLVCEAEKSALKFDCERLKSLQMAAGEIGEACIQEARSQALARNPRPVPQFIRSALAKYFDINLLDSVRWTVGTGDVLDVCTKLAFDFGQRDAITYDDVIVFKSESDAQYDVGLWAHELEHVKQYRLLGIDHFGEYYSDYWIEEYITRRFFLRNPFAIKRNITPRDVEEYVASHFNKLEALATVQSTYVCDKIDYDRSYDYKASVFDSEGRIIKRDSLLCAPR